MSFMCFTSASLSNQSLTDLWPRWQHIRSSCQKGAHVTVSVWVSCSHRCQSELKATNIAESFYPGMTAGCTCSCWGHNPDVKRLIKAGIGIAIVHHKFKAEEWKRSITVFRSFFSITCFLTLYSPFAKMLRKRIFPAVLWTFKVGDGAWRRPLFTVIWM